MLFILLYIGLIIIVLCILIENDIIISVVVIYSFFRIEMIKYSRRWFICGVVKESDVAVFVGGDSDGEGRVVYYIVYLLEYMIL